MSDDPRIGIVRMPMGNLQSAFNAVYQLGFDPEFIEIGDDFDDFTHLIVPGDGNFRAVMAHLEEVGTADRIRAFAASGRPTLGICVGMQILASLGTESASTRGLDLIPGQVDRIACDASHRLPHIGWNTVRFTARHPVFADIKPDRDFYFVHSFAFTTADPAHTIGVSEYGASFASIVARDNVLGFQFHPEKSQANGLRLVENFCNWDGTC
jgi:glutamine amidotransferase